MVRILLLSLILCVAYAQEKLPEDNSLPSVSAYHPAPDYRESESHPLRIVAYVLHPIGWVIREGIFRPWSYFASSTPTLQSVFGYRDPYDFRHPSCFSADTSVPDCKTISPYNYATINAANRGGTENAVYLPDINFDFDKGRLNDLGRGRVKEAYDQILAKPEALNIILEGHTDSAGSEKYNNKLGLNRSEAVKAELIRLGIPKERLSAVTFGESKPKSEDPSVNRRVEVKLQ